jgi:hypothetical protein
VLPGHAVIAETREITRSRMTRSLSYLHCGGDVTALHPIAAVFIVVILLEFGRATVLLLLRDCVCPLAELYSCKNTTFRELALSVLIKKRGMD